ncbi:MAG: hypothetical protein ACI3Y0_04845 [Prevotella sp.]
METVSVKLEVLMPFLLYSIGVTDVSKISDGCCYADGTVCCRADIKGCFNFCSENIMWLNESGISVEIVGNRTGVFVWFKFTKTSSWNKSKQKIEIPKEVFSRIMLKFLDEVFYCEHKDLNVSAEDADKEFKVKYEMDESFFEDFVVNRGFSKFLCDNDVIIYTKKEKEKWFYVVSKIVE